MPKDTDTITFRPMTSEDVGAVPIGHQGDEQEVRARIQDLGSSAILAFDATQHVGQLQFRRYAADTRSPKGLWDPLYWGEFGNEAPALPDRTLSIYCYHVGQLDDTDDRDRADARYLFWNQGRGGIGLRLLDFLGSELRLGQDRPASAIGGVTGPRLRQCSTRRGCHHISSASVEDIHKAFRESGLYRILQISEPPAKPFSGEFSLHILRYLRRYLQESEERYSKVVEEREATTASCTLLLIETIFLHTRQPQNF